MNKQNINPSIIWCTPKLTNNLPTIKSVNEVNFYK